MEKCGQVWTPSPARSAVSEPLLVRGLRAGQVGVPHEGAVGQEQCELVFQRQPAGQRAGEQLDLAQPRQPGDMRLQGLALSQVVQPPQAGAGFEAGAIRGVEQTHQDAVAVIEQGGIGGHAHAAACDRDLARQIAEIPAARDRAVPGGVLQLPRRARRRRCEFAAQAVQAGIDRQRLAPLVHQADLHHQMRRQAIDLERFGRNPLTGKLLQHARECGQERALAKRQRSGGLPRRVGGGNQTVRIDFGSVRISADLLSDGRHQPVDLCGRDLIDRLPRDRHGYAILDLSGGEVVLERKLRAVQRHGVGIQGRHVGRHTLA